MNDNGLYTYGDFLDAYNAAPTEQHTVEDSRTHPTRQATPTAPPVQRPDSKRRKRPVKKRRYKMGIAVAIIVALFFTVLLLIDFAMPNGVAGYVSEAFAPKGNYVYAVCYASYDTLDEARAAADGVRPKGGAGFIAFDGKYRLLLSAYANREDADNVANKNGYEVFSIRTDGLGADDFPIAIRAKAKPLLQYHTDLFAKLYDLSDQLAQNGTNVPYCRQRVAAIKDALQAQAEPFLEATQSVSDTTTCNYRSVLSGALAALENLAEQENETLFLADIRWTYLMILRANRL